MEQNVTFTFTREQVNLLWRAACRESAKTSKMIHDYDKPDAPPSYRKCVPKYKHDLEMIHGLCKVFCDAENAFKLAEVAVDTPRVKPGDSPFNDHSFQWEVLHNLRERSIPAVRACPALP